ncbi:hypothetical protein ACJX0J_017496, partial [Zea mays]
MLNGFPGKHIKLHNNAQKSKHVLTGASIYLAMAIDIPQWVDFYGGVERKTLLLHYLNQSQRGLLTEGLSFDTTKGVESSRQIILASEAFKVFYSYLDLVLLNETTATIWLHWHAM